ncbi:hypothetical protein [Rhodohalobacter sp. SW132]|uniref:hypothetical protein n=1 Tax=Rhodohalobacter sp. SW132 TaxID=2293433 RepID=UPI0011C02F7D|nr:hypothetical protein [Rhodohalobacter sp. SW132]
MSQLMSCRAPTRHLPFKSGRWILPLAEWILCAEMEDRGSGSAMTEIDHESIDVMPCSDTASPI